MKQEQVQELANLLREPTLAVVVVVVVVLAAVMVFAIGIESLLRRRKPRLGVSLKPSPHPAIGAGGVAKDDRIVAVGDLAAVAVAAAAVAGAEGQRQVRR
ncbi:hypothetical protein CR513_26743, partial [Mucuna pruriens]